MAQTQVRLLPGGMPSPTGAAAGAVAGGGTFAAATYFWKITYLTDFGETEASNEASAAIALNGSATISWTAPPAGVRQVNIYRGTTSGNENALVGSVGGTGAAASVAGPFTDTGAAGTAQTPPAVTNFTNVSLTASGEVSDSDAILSTLNADQLLQALAAANQWQNSGGTSTEAQDTANAAGVGLNWA